MSIWVMIDGGGPQGKYGMWDFEPPSTKIILCVWGTDCCMYVLVNVNIPISLLFPVSAAGSVLVFFPP